MKILGISCYYHDAAAALIIDGKIVAACEEERFTRIKHDSAFPKNAINFCLTQGAISNSDLDYVVFYEKPFRKLHRILISTLATYPWSYQAFREALRIWLTQKLWIKNEIAEYLEISRDRILFTSHHLAHAASAFYPSSFKNSAILTVDGVGEWATTTFCIGKNHQIKLIKQINFPHSLGLFYSAFTAFLGFEVNEGEWKVMGLAPYGKPVFADKIRQLVEKNPDGSFRLDLTFFSYHYSDSKSFTKKFEQLFGPPISQKKSHLITTRSADIAASVQKVTEELLVSLAKQLHQESGLTNLCLAGGVALNSVANYKILEFSGFKNIHIQPASGDSGGALGAALYVYHHILNHQKRYQLAHAYLGISPTTKEIETVLKNNHTPYQKLSPSKLCELISREIAAGKVVGWLQGRSEWGPRALGARSILADARRRNMKDTINSKVKFREAFRPFAPSVLAEHAGKIFSLPRNYHQHEPLKYMLYVVPVKKNWRKRIPAVNHADNTARPQLVYQKQNPLYYRLIKTFAHKTGVPLLLNTSFNLRGEPIVNTPQDAYSTFIRSGIDILIMRNYVCKKT